MADENNNFSQPFGTNAGNPPNRPLDITSDLWTPISTGKPVPGTARLHDAQSTVEHQAPQTAPDSEVPARRKRTKKRGDSPKKATAAKRSAKKKGANKPKKETSPSKKALVASRAEELRRQSAENKRRRNARQQHLRAQKSQEIFERRRQNGDSGDDIRRGNARRKRKRKQLAALLTVAAVLLLAGLAALIYCFTYGAPISQVVVTGDSIYSPEEIINASGILPGDNMFRIHTRSMNKRLCSLLPYIGSVQVDYQLPDVLSLEVTPTTEKYLISGKSAYLCLDNDRKILSVKKKKVQEGQFRLDGFDLAEGTVGTRYQPEGEDKARFEAAQEIAEVLLENGLQKANIMNLSGLSDIVLRFDGRINIYLGTTKNLSVRLRAAAETLQNHLSDNTIGYLEITHEGRIYLYEGSMTK